MELIRGFHNLRERHRGCVLSIGNFDGFHLGHQALVAQLREHSQKAGLPAVVMAFEPTPREYFTKVAPGRIATFRDRRKSLIGAGVDRFLCARFDRRLATMPAERFVEDVLVKRLGARTIVVGDDFRFGAGRGGDLALLHRLGERHGFSAESLPSVRVEGERVSSTAVRTALALPDLIKASRLLGRPYVMSGRVRPGLQLGRKLGMPTANFTLSHPPALALGIYAVRVRMGGAQAAMGVASLGVRPTLGLTRCLLETHVLDLREQTDLYGKELEVEFVKYLRPERRFESLDLLAAAMRADGEAARACLAS